MDHRIHLNLATTASIVVIGIGVSIVTSTVVAARAYEQRGQAALKREQSITVKGSVRKRVRSDRAVWLITVQAVGHELSGAFDKLELTSAAVRDFLTKQGFQPGEIGLSAIDTTVQHERDEKGGEKPQIFGYALSRRYCLTTGDVERVSRSAGEVTTLIREGLLVISHAPDYYCTQLPQLRVELLGLAAQDARRRADEIAANAGGRVAEVRSAQMGVLQVTRPDSTEVSDYGQYDTDTIEKDVQAVVTVTFRIES